MTTTEKVTPEAELEVLDLLEPMTLAAVACHGELHHLEDQFFRDAAVRLGALVLVSPQPATCLLALVLVTGEVFALLDELGRQAAADPEVIVDRGELLRSAIAVKRSILQRRIDQARGGAA